MVKAALREHNSRGDGYLGPIVAIGQVMIIKYVKDENAMRTQEATSWKRYQPAARATGCNEPEASATESHQPKASHTRVNIKTCEDLRGSIAVSNALLFNGWEKWCQIIFAKFLWHG